MNAMVSPLASNHAPHRPPHQSGSFDIREYYYAVKSRLVIVLFCLLIGLFVGIFKSATQTTLYSAKSVLFIEQVKSRVLSLKVEDVRDDQIRSLDMINTLVDTMKSYPFALRMAEHYKLGQDQKFLSAAGFFSSQVSPEQAAAVLVKMVNPSYRLNTRLIDIVITTKVPAVSVKLANDYAEEYLRYVHDQKIEATHLATSFLVEESDRLRAKMKASEEGMQTFRERERAASIETMLLDSQKQIADISTRQGAIDSRLTQLNSDLEIARKCNGNTQELLRLPSIATEPKVAALVTQIDTLNGQLVLIKQRYRSKHPVYISTKTQAEVATAELNKVLSDAVGLLQSLKQSLEDQKASEKIERQQAEDRLLLVTSKSIEYNDLKRELESDTALYNAVVSRIKEVDVTRELSDAPIEIQETATGVSRIAKPAWSLILNGLLYGFAVGVGICIGIYKLDTSIKSVDQIEHLTGLPVVAAIPQIGGITTSKHGLLSKEQYEQLREAGRNALSILKDSTKSIEKRYTESLDILRPAWAMIANPYATNPLAPGSELVVKDDRGGMVAEAFRSLRASIAMNALSEKQRVFLFTSAVPSEGKSFSSANFSITLAHQELKTLLIDADLRKPSISRIFFGMNRKPGLSEVLLGTKKLADSVNPSGVSGLDILTAGGRSNNPSELLAGKPFRELIEEALRTYDRVVIDSAPVLAVSDTLLIAPSAQVLCLVARSFMTPGRMIQRALKTLADVDVKPAGIVFNCIPYANGSYSFYYSGKYYGTYGSKGVYGT